MFGSHDFDFPPRSRVTPTRQESDAPRHPQERIPSINQNSLSETPSFCQSLKQNRFPGDQGCPVTKSWSPFSFVHVLHLPARRATAPQTHGTTPSTTKKGPSGDPERNSLTSVVPKKTVLGLLADLGFISNRFIEQSAERSIPKPCELHLLALPWNSYFKSNHLISSLNNPLEGEHIKHYMVHSFLLLFQALDFPFTIVLLFEPPPQIPTVPPSPAVPTCHRWACAAGPSWWLPEPGAGVQRRPTSVPRDPVVPSQVIGDYLYRRQEGPVVCGSLS